MLLPDAGDAGRSTLGFRLVVLLSTFQRERSDLLLLLCTMFFLWPAVLGALVSVQSFVSHAHAKVVGAAVLPHGDFAFDPSLVDFKNHSVALHDGSKLVGAAIADLEPDLIVLTTPHGIESERDFVFYKNSNGSGFASIGDDLHNASFPSYKVPLNVTMDPDTVAHLASSLLALNPSANVSTLLSFADSEAQALRWGEVVPLKLIFDEYNKTSSGNGSDGASLPHVVIWSVPSRRYTQTDTMVGSGEMTSLGEDLGHTLEAMPERVVVVVSADLAHTHLASGPYGYSKDAEPFDEACGVWARSLNRSALLDTALQHAAHAESCGYTGLVVLDGLLQSTPNNSALGAVHGRRLRGAGSSHKVEWNSSIVVGPFHPTYYGMMPAMFELISA